MSKFNLKINELGGWTTKVSVVSQNGKPLEIINKQLYSNELITSKELNVEQFIKFCLKFSLLFCTTNSNKRRLDDFEKTNMLVYDFDDGTTEEDIKEKLGNYSYLIFGSSSHMKEKNGVVAPRFHVIVPLKEYITDEKYYRFLSKHIGKKNKWHADTCSSTVTQYYKKRSSLVFKNAGYLLNPNDYKKEYKMYEQHQGIMNDLMNETVKKYENMPLETKLKYVLTDELKNGVNDDGRRHNSILILASRFKKFGFGIDKCVVEIRNLYNGNERNWTQHKKSITWIYSQTT